MSSAKIDVYARRFLLVCWVLLMIALIVRYTLRFLEQ